MSNSSGDIDALKKMHEKARQIKAQSSAEKDETAPEADRQAGPESRKSKTGIPESEKTDNASQAQETESSALNSPETKPPQQDDDGEKDHSTDWSGTIQDIIANCENVIKSVEDAARERPVLVLLTAFTTGIVVGSILNRR